MSPKSQSLEDVVSNGRDPLIEIALKKIPKDASTIYLDNNMLDKIIEDIIENKFKEKLKILETPINELDITIINELNETIKQATKGEEKSPEWVYISRDRGPIKPQDIENKIVIVYRPYWVMRSRNGITAIDAIKGEMYLNKHIENAKNIDHPIPASIGAAETLGLNVNMTDFLKNQELTIKHTVQIFDEKKSYMREEEAMEIANNYEKSWGAQLYYIPHLLIEHVIPGKMTNEVMIWHQLKRDSSKNNATATRSTLKQEVIYQLTFYSNYDAVNGIELKDQNRTESFIKYNEAQGKFIRKFGEEETPYHLRPKFITFEEYEKNLELSKFLSNIKIEHKVKSEKILERTKVESIDQSLKSIWDWVRMVPYLFLLPFYLIDTWGDKDTYHYFQSPEYSQVTSKGNYKTTGYIGYGKTRQNNIYLRGNKNE